MAKVLSGPHFYCLYQIWCESVQYWPSCCRLTDFKMVAVAILDYYGNSGPPTKSPWWPELIVCTVQISYQSNYYFQTCGHSTVDSTWQLASGLCACTMHMKRPVHTHDGSLLCPRAVQYLAVCTVNRCCFVTWKLVANTQWDCSAQLYIHRITCMTWRDDFLSQYNNPVVHWEKLHANVSDLSYLTYLDNVILRPTILNQSNELFHLN